MKKVVQIIAIIICTILLIQANTVFAQNQDDVKIEVVKQQIEKVENTDIGFEKKIINVNQDTKEVTIQLSLESYKEEETSNENMEVVFVVDSSSSMDTKLSNSSITRRQEVTSAVRDTANKIFSINNKIKIGIVMFDKTATVLTKPTNESILIDVGLNVYSKAPAGTDTNIYSGLIAGKGNFSSTAKNKTLILLTDGVPTKNVNEVKQELKDDDIFIITALIGLKDNTSYADTIQSIFGTKDNPTANEYYNVDAENISTTMTEDIYENVLENTKKYLSNLKIDDYFPPEILNNFTIESESATKGTATINGNYIEWDMNALKSKEKETVEYTLKLKEDYDTNIIEQILNTNKNVEINYSDTEAVPRTVSVTDTPQIILKKEKTNEEINNVTNEQANEQTNEETNIQINETVNTQTNNLKNNQINIKQKDNTVSNGKLPQTGVKNYIIPLIIVIIVLIILQRLNMKRFE